MEIKEKIENKNNKIIIMNLPNYQNGKFADRIEMDIKRLESLIFYLAELIDNKNQ